MLLELPKFDTETRSEQMVLKKWLAQSKVATHLQFAKMQYFQSTIK